MSKLEMNDMGNNVFIAFDSFDSGKLANGPGEDTETQYFSMLTEADGIKEAVNYNIPIAEYFGYGAVQELDGSEFLGDALHGNPYLALAHDGISSVASFAFADNHLHTNFAMFDGKNEQSNYSTSGMASEVAANFDDFALSSQFGVVHEEESFLGSHSSGAFAIGGESTPTYFYNLSASVNLAKDTRLFGLFTQGVTKPEDAEGSLINSVSTITSRSFAGGYYA